MSLNLKELSKYKCVPGVSGINFMNIGDTKGILVDCVTESKHRVKVAISKNRVEVYNPNEMPYRLGQHMHTVVESGVFKPEVVTENTNGDRHFDFYARSFIEATLRFYESSGLTISNWESWWPNGTRNNDEFYKFLEGNNDEDRISAAIKSTWSYKVARRNRFSTITRYSIDSDGVSVVFSR